MPRFTRNKISFGFMINRKQATAVFETVGGDRKAHNMPAIQAIPKLGQGVHATFLRNNSIVSFLCQLSIVVSLYTDEC